MTQMAWLSVRDVCRAGVGGEAEAAAPGGAPGRRPPASRWEGGLTAHARHAKQLDWEIYLLSLAALGWSVRLVAVAVGRQREVPHARAGPAKRHRDSNKAIPMARPTRRAHSTECWLCYAGRMLQHSVSHAVHSRWEHVVQHWLRHPQQAQQQLPAQQPAGSRRQQRRLRNFKP